MGLWDALRTFAGAVEVEYDRRIRSASHVKHYDPTGASHQHGAHVELHNEHVEQVEDAVAAHGYVRAGGDREPSEQPALH